MRLVPFEPHHLGRIAAGRFEALATAGRAMDRLPHDFSMPGPAFTLIAEDRCVLGCGGLVPLWRGVAQGWIYASDRLRGHPVALHRTVYRALAAAEAALGLHRIEISVHADFAASRRWVAHLGFHCEGAMPGFGPNKDTYYRYARTKP